MADVTNSQLYLAVGLPTLAVITSLILSFLQVSGIREEMKNLREDMKILREDMRSIREEMQALRSEVRDDIREIRSDIKLLTGKVYELMSDKR